MSRLGMELKVVEKLYKNTFVHPTDDDILKVICSPFGIDRNSPCFVEAILNILMCLQTLIIMGKPSEIFRDTKTNYWYPSYYEDIEPELLEFKDKNMMMFILKPVNTDDIYDYCTVYCPKDIDEYIKYLFEYRKNQMYILKKFKETHLNCNKCHHHKCINKNPSFHKKMLKRINTTSLKRMSSTKSLSSESTTISKIRTNSICTTPRNQQLRAIGYSPRTKSNIV